MAKSREGESKEGEERSSPAVSVSISTNGSIHGLMEDLSVSGSAPNSMLSENERPSRQIRKRKVSFTNIEIRSYNRTISDHPAVSSGPGIALDWDYNPSPRVYSVEDYERVHGFYRKPNRCDLVLSRQERESILREECGYARSELAKCVRSIVLAKKNRRQTVNNMDMTLFEERVEKMKRNFSRIVGKRKATKKQIQLLWKEARQHAIANRDELSSSDSGERSIQSIIRSASSLSKAESRDKVGPMQAPPSISVVENESKSQDNSESSLGSATEESSRTPSSPYLQTHIDYSTNEQKDGTSSKTRITATEDNSDLPRFGALKQ